MKLVVSVSSPISDVYNSFFVVKQLVLRCLAPQYAITDCPSRGRIHIHVGNPEEEQLSYADEFLPRTVLFCFCEANRIPCRWVPRLNRALEVWVPSAFSRDAFLACGTTAPMRVVPLGVDTLAFPLRPAAARNSGPYLVLWQGTTGLADTAHSPDWDGDRKRAGLVVRAFKRAKLPNSRLILKSVPFRSGEYVFRRDPVWEICQDLTRRQMLAIDQGADLFVWPTYGEAFGLPPLEKLSQGMPALVTNWSGCAEYLKDYPIPALNDFQLVPVDYGGTWALMADVSEDSLTEALVQAHAARDHLRECAADLRNITVEKWDFRASMRPAVLSALEDLMENLAYADSK
jgi:glycosyltransferase involved in cell wall biosynthesis